MSTTQLDMFTALDPPKPKPPARPATGVIPPGEYASVMARMDALRQEKLAVLDLRFGAVHVVRHEGKLYAWGDLGHCPQEDIAHNMKRLVALMRERRWPGIWKDAYEGVGQADAKEAGFRKFMREAFSIYRETVWLLDEQGDPVDVAQEAPTGELMIEADGQPRKRQARG